MPTLSVVISAYNEEKRLEKTLESVPFADEIVVVDNSSIDRTPLIAKRYTKKVYTRPNYAMLNINKNFGFTKATGDWILSLDADETVSPELAKEIKEKIESCKLEIGESSVSGYWIPRKNIIFGKWIRHSLWWPDYQLRLFKNGKGKFPEKHVHEMIALEGTSEKFNNPLKHDNYSSISQFIKKMDTLYTESEVQNRIKSGIKVSWTDAISYPFGDFIKTFFSQQGYKDGLHGLTLSMLQAFYMFIVFAKMWEKQGFFEYNDGSFLEKTRKLFLDKAKEVQYWYYSSKIKETKRIVDKLYYRLLRKFR